MFRKRKMYRVLKITAGNVEQHMGTEYEMLIRTYYEMVCNAILQGTLCDIVLQTSDGIAMSFHGTGKMAG